MHMIETIWFAIWGVAWAVYFMLDGFDLGIGSLLPFLGKSETDKRVMINAMGPFWDGNEVWLLTAGGVTFAAFPRTYAVMFSGLYTPLMLLLFALILRGVAFEFRGKVASASWVKLWDACLVIGSFVPALLLGVAFANIFAGIPIDQQGIFQGNLLHPSQPVRPRRWRAVRSPVCGPRRHLAGHAIRGRFAGARREDSQDPLCSSRGHGGGFPGHDLVLDATLAEPAGCAVLVAAAASCRVGSAWRAVVLGQRRVLEGLVLVGLADRGCGSVRRGGTLPEPLAVEPGSGGVDDGLQFVIQSPDAVDHVRRGGLLLAGSHRVSIWVHTKFRDTITASSIREGPAY